MTSVGAINGLVSAHSGAAYGAVMLLAFLEAVPIIGSVIPGSVLIIAIAAMIPTGSVQFWPLMIAAIVGAILGDGLPYWLGHRYREAILRRWPLDRSPALVDKSRRFIHRHGGKSIFLARFTPGVRGFVPVMAGIVGMPARRFTIVNIVSAFAWAPAHILPGMLVGTSLALAGAAASRLALLLVTIVVLLWILIWAIRLVHSAGRPLVAAAEGRLRQWSDPGDSWLARQVRSLIDPERSEARALLLWSGVVAAAAWTFFAVLEDVVSGDPLVRADVAVYHALQGLRTPSGDAFMIFITELGDTFVTASVTVIVLLWLFTRRAWRPALYWAAAVGFAAALNTITKLAIHRARPADLAYAGASEYSFPSGHATVNAVLYGFLAFLVTRQLRKTWRLPVFAVFASFAMLIAFSRLYLGAHWFSDVAGSLTFATAWVIVLALAYVRHPEMPFDGRKLAAIAWCAVGIVGGFNVIRSHSRDVQRYAVRYEAPTISAADWLAGRWQELPVRRVDLAGEGEEPLMLQWAGTPAGLKDALRSSGWTEAGPWTTSGFLSWLMTADARTLPVIPSLEAGQLPGLTLIRSMDSDPQSRFVLRIWPANYVLRNGASEPLWVGSLVRESISRPFSFVTFVRSDPADSGTIELLARPLNGRVSARAVRPAEWTGPVLLARQTARSVGAADRQAGGGR